jgi:hypothetical protein
MPTKLDADVTRRVSNSSYRWRHLLWVRCRLPRPLAQGSCRRPAHCLLEPAAHCCCASCCQSFFYKWAPIGWARQAVSCLFQSFRAAHPVRCKPDSRTAQGVSRGAMVCSEKRCTRGTQPLPDWLQPLFGYLNDDRISEEQLVHKLHAALSVSGVSK